ncbi:unnamed protein product [Ectocarpus sp. CCAP 1310/34]|nr:unnamed protein product [Ectocarpus sp. CCAP 1310/34]CAB1116236.1 unnamed protein product [Ectocarpus sp. CCAP 1310/34]
MGVLGQDLSGMAHGAAAAHALFTAAEALVTDLNEGIAVLQRQATIAEGDASKHASMLQERVGILGEDLAGMADRPVAAHARCTAAEARVTDLNERLADMHKQQTTAAGAASEHALTCKNELRCSARTSKRWLTMPPLRTTDLRLRRRV